MHADGPAETPTDEPSSTTAEGQIDRVFLSRVGTRIRELRTERSMTVQALATRSRISRRLLTQIELGQANPSLVAITRIARQLGTDSTWLLEGADEEQTPLQRLPRSGHVLVWRSAGGSTAHLVASTSGVRSADMWLWRLAPGDAYRGNPDPEGSQELFHVLEGTVMISAAGLTIEVAAGDAARLHSDRTYSYSNTGTTLTTFLRTVTLGP